MVPQYDVSNESAPLHELISRILETDPEPTQGLARLIPTMGTLQSWNQSLERYPLADFLNSILRGIGQVIFVNNPISGLLILTALFIQSPWVGQLGLLGVISSTLAAQWFTLDRATRRNGIFGYNGLLVGAAFATFSDPQGGTAGWLAFTVVGAVFTTVLMVTFGVWWAKTFNSPPLTLPFNIITLLGLGLVKGVPQPFLKLGTVAPSPDTVLHWQPLLTALPIGFGQVFLADQWLAGGLIFLAVLICTPLGALVGLIGGILGLLVGVLVGISPNTLYAGLWGYNAVLTAMAIGGIFYAPNLRSVSIGAIAAFVSALLGGALGLLFSPLGLPTLTISFCIVTIGCFVILQHSLPSLVPVALHALTSPEEHLHRYNAAQAVITNFRQQLGRALSKQQRFYLLEQASLETKGDLQYLFNCIDVDRSGALSTQELAGHLHQAGQIQSDQELMYLFNCMDRDGSGSIDFQEFGELMLRHRRLMANYAEFITYFLPIDANGDDAISLTEMNVAMASVGEPQLSAIESSYLLQHAQGQSLSWNRFVEMLLIT